MRTEERKKAIDLLNTLEILDADGDGEVMYFVLVPDDKTTRDVLHSLRANEICKNYLEEFSENGAVDIVPVAFEYANWFDGKRFVWEEADHD